MNDIRNIGIVAHADAGKTTVTENMLYLSGSIRKLGSVDEGTAQTDFLDVERQRGISVRAATTAFKWKDYSVNLIDTPGHVDFASEVERSLRVLDGAILIISAAEGIQPHTVTLWKALRSMNIPTLFFINKMDRIGADSGGVLDDINHSFTDMAIPIQKPVGREKSFTGVEDLLIKGKCDGIIDKLSIIDEDILNKFINEEKISADDIKSKIKFYANKGKLFPLLYGAANNGIGVKELMDAVIDYLPSPQADENKPLSAVVFKIAKDKVMGRLSYVRLYNGLIKNRDLIHDYTQNIDMKIAQIRKIYISSYEDTGIVKAGDIAALCGIDARCGDILGVPDAVPKEHKIAVPLLTVQVHEKDSDDYYKLVRALQELDAEDPLLEFQWLQEEREMHIKVMGVMQIEILSSLLKERYGIEAAFDEPSVIYKETPVKRGIGFVAYTMPKPCWAVLKFDMEPGERGSGIAYKSLVNTDKILKRYQNDVEKTIPLALRQGLYGWEVTDIKITLIDGEDHVMHTHPQDFVVATPMALMNGLLNTGVKLLEPILRFRINVKEEYLGKVLSDLSKMRANFENPVLINKTGYVEGDIPLSTSMDYPLKLGTITKGTSGMSTRFLCYRECPEGFTLSRKRYGVNPLDRSKYILSVRGAL